MDEKQGIGVYSQNLMDELLKLDSDNEYVLFYKNDKFLGRYAKYPNVAEKEIHCPSKLLWDQIAIPRAVTKEKLDVLFHTKFTVPFLAKCKTVMTIHGASWFVRPELYPDKLDLAYIKLMMPLYCKKSSLILSNSELTTNDFVRILKVPRGKIRTTRLGTNDSFKPIDDDGQLAKIRNKFDLPEKYILSVIKYDPRKNFKNLIAAFRLLRKRTSCKIVVTGLGCEKYIEEYSLDKDGTINDIQFLGWVEQEDLPSLYSMAYCLFFPSVYEEFGIPSCEAMACGCPAVVSKTGALPEIVDDAGILVDQFNPEEMAIALENLWNDPETRANYSKKALERAKIFTWKRCASETLDAINSLK